MTTIHFASDLHFEINGWIPSVDRLPGGDVLVLAGDIHCSRFFREKRTDAEARSAQKMFKSKLDPVFKRYGTVYHLMGNHEYYGDNWLKARETFEDFYVSAGLDNVRAVESGSFDIAPNARLILSTLWSSLDVTNPYDLSHIAYSMNDYRVITSNDEGAVLTVRDTKAAHMRYVKELEESLKGSSGKKVVVATHHAPSYESETRYRGSILSPAYCSDLRHIMHDNPNIAYWIHGHTHSNTSYTVNETKIVTAMHGYYMDRKRGEKFEYGEIVL